MRGCLRLHGTQAGVDLLPDVISVFKKGPARPGLHGALLGARGAELYKVHGREDRRTTVVEPVRDGSSLEWHGSESGRRPAEAAGGRSVDDGGVTDVDVGGAGHSNENEDLAPRWRLLAVSHAQNYLSPAEVQVSVDGLAVGGPVAAQLPIADAATRISVLDGFDGVAASIALLEGAASLKALRGAFWRGPRGGPGAAAGAFRRGEQHGESDDETRPSRWRSCVACALEPGPFAALKRPTWRGRGRRRRSMPGLEGRRVRASERRERVVEATQRESASARRRQKTTTKTPGRAGNGAWARAARRASGRGVDSPAGPSRAHRRWPHSERGAGRLVRRRRRERGAAVVVLRAGLRVCVITGRRRISKKVRRRARGARSGRTFYTVGHESYKGRVRDQRGPR